MDALRSQVALVTSTVTHVATRQVGLNAGTSRRGSAGTLKPAACAAVKRGLFRAMLPRSISEVAEVARGGDPQRVGHI